MIRSAKNIGNSIRIALLVGAIPFFAVPSCAPKERRSIPPLEPVPAEVKPVAKPPPKPPGQLTRMPLGSLYQLVQSKSVLVFDVRPSFAYTLGHIPGAISWPKKSFMADPSKFENEIRSANSRNIPVVLYCTDLACPDGLTVATALVERGHSVAVLQGGYEAWTIATE